MKRPAKQRRSVSPKQRRASSRKSRPLRTPGIRREGIQRGRTRRVSTPAERAASGYHLGRLLAGVYPVQLSEVRGARPDPDGLADDKLDMSVLWSRHANTLGITTLQGEDYAAAAASFALGYCEERGLPDQNWLPLPTHRTIAAVVKLREEAGAAETAALLRELNRIPLHELILVPEDGTHPVREEIRALIPPGAKLLEAAGNEDGGLFRGIQSDLVLVLETGCASKAEDFVPFVLLTNSGIDIALSDSSSDLPLFHLREDREIVKQFVNYSLGRGDLLADSLTAVPHAMSKQAIERIGDHLSDPAKAHAAALLGGLAVASVGNRGKRKHARGRRPLYASVDRSSVGSHLEGLRLAMEKKGSRILYPDNWRKREYAENG
ncbi:hypothetical protein [Paenibacillus lutrae]|uniref:Uncharacterized protein n=1 Tax=Paenibacillus lutrae TaxID=2078573 RepID=A0A7X3FDS7_9BACL|nr:hypothetical protein [Paenibacillus lutrae]MVO97949.1 hypothetical protein [Paenibacillus lutrae]